MKAKLQEYALVAEIVSAFCIVASLIFVGVQINQNSTTVEINAYDQFRQGLNNLNVLIVENPEFSTIIQKSISEEFLTPAEERQLTSFSFYLFTMGDMSFKKYKSNIITERELEQALSPVGYWSNQSKFIKRYWDIVSEGPALDDEYIAYVNENIVY